MLPEVGSTIVPPGAELPLTLGCLDHREADAILVRATRVEELELREQRRLARRRRTGRAARSGSSRRGRGGSGSARLTAEDYAAAVVSGTDPYLPARRSAFGRMAQPLPARHDRAMHERSDAEHRPLCTIELIADGHAARCPGDECAFWDRGCVLSRIELELEHRPEVAQLLLDLRGELEAGRTIELEGHDRPSRTSSTTRRGSTRRSDGGSRVRRRDAGRPRH